MEEGRAQSKGLEHFNEFKPIRVITTFQSLMKAKLCQQKRTVGEQCTGVTYNLPPFWPWN